MRREVGRGLEAVMYVVLLLMVMLLYALGQEIKCRQAGDRMDTNVSYEVSTGCLAEYNDEWIPIENIP